MQDITKLKAAGVCTILGVAQTTRKNLLKIKVSVELQMESLTGGWS
jgi:meiotic recombination protein DMC1